MKENPKISISNSDDFKKIIDKISKSKESLKYLFEEDKVIYERLNSTEIWDSELQRKYCHKYLDIVNSYGVIITSLEKYISFLNSIILSYERLENGLLSDLNNLTDSLNVN